MKWDGFIPSHFVFCEIINRKNRHKKMNDVDIVNRINRHQNDYHVDIVNRLNRHNNDYHVDIINRINRHPNVWCRQTSYILVSATVASDKGSTTLGVRGALRWCIMVISWQMVRFIMWGLQRAERPCPRPLPRVRKHERKRTNGSDVNYLKSLILHRWQKNTTSDILWCSNLWFHYRNVFTKVAYWWYY